MLSIGSGPFVISIQFSNLFSYRNSLIFRFLRINSEKAQSLIVLNSSYIFLSTEIFAAIDERVEIYAIGFFVIQEPRTTIYISKQFHIKSAVRLFNYR